MYENHFNIKELPFSLSPDTSYFFGHVGHQQALNVLLVALQSGEGFIKITGDVGTGKTLLCRELLKRLDEQYYTAYIPNPYLSPYGLRYALAQELGVETSYAADQNRLLNLINERLLQLSTEGRKVVICLDEVQSMPDSALEALRLLSNLETEKSKLLHIVLFGQPELNDKLSRVQNRQLLQRIVYSHELQPLDYSRMVAYIHHRLSVAGYNGDPVFDDNALEAVFTASRGVPRLVNILCHKAMLLAYGKGIHYADSHCIQDAINDTEGAKPLSRFKVTLGRYLTVGYGL